MRNSDEQEAYKDGREKDEEEGEGEEGAGADDGGTCGESEEVGDETGLPHIHSGGTGIKNAGLEASRKVKSEQGE